MITNYALVLALALSGLGACVRNDDADRIQSEACAAFDQDDAIPYLWTDENPIGWPTGPWEIPCPDGRSWLIAPAGWSVGRHAVRCHSDPWFAGGNGAFAHLYVLEDDGVSPPQPPQLEYTCEPIDLYKG